MYSKHFTQNVELALYCNEAVTIGKFKVILHVLASYVAGFEMLRVLYFIFPFNSPQTKGNSF
jgi:hypothetical protein